MHFPQGKLPPGADGVIEVDFLVSREGTFLFEDDVLQKVHELAKGAQLLGGRFPVLVITHQADADAVVVDLGLLYVTASSLTLPAWADLDLAVARVLAAADAEVVGAPVAQALYVAMVVVVCLGVARLDAAVVDDEPFPPLGVDHDGAGGGGDVPDVLELGQACGDDLGLPDAYEVALQAVGLLDVLYRGLKTNGEVAEGVSLFHQVLVPGELVCAGNSGQTQACPEEAATEGPASPARSAFSETRLRPWSHPLAFPSCIVPP